jgi:hypothetical protein
MPLLLERKIDNFIFYCITSQTWTEIFNTKLAITKLAIDCTSFEGCIGNDNVLMSEKIFSIKM